MIIISHDRHFLNSVCTHMADLDYGELRLFPGNYDEYMTVATQSREQLLSDNAKKKAQISELQSFVSRFSANASKAKQATSRAKAIDKIQLAEVKPSSRVSPFIRFEQTKKLHRQAVIVDRMAKGFDGKTLFKDFSFQVEAGERVAIIGPNGIGKTTLLRTLVNELQPDAGTVKWTDAAEIGYYAQDHAHDFEDDSTLFDWMGQWTQGGEQLVRGTLGRMLFSNDEILKSVKVISGGEQGRMLFGKLILQKPNVLVMDEPTNHLDLEMRLALTMALQEFGGAVLVVSHDRHLLKSTTDDFLLVADGRVQEFDGDLDDYTRWLADYRLRNAPVSSTPVNADKTDKKAQRQQAAALRQQLAPHKREADKLERDLGLVNEKLAKVEEALADSTNYEAANKDKLRDLLAEQAKLKVRESELEDAWMQALELLESMQAELEALS